MAAAPLGARAAELSPRLVQYDAPYATPMQYYAPDPDWREDWGRAIGQVLNSR